MQADLVTNQTLQLENPTIDNATVCGSWQAMAAEWWTSQAKGLKTEKPQTLRRHKLVSVGACPLGPHIADTSGVNLCVANLAISRSRFYGFG